MLPLGESTDLDAYIALQKHIQLIGNCLSSIHRLHGKDWSWRCARSLHGPATRPAVSPTQPYLLVKASSSTHISILLLICFIGIRSSHITHHQPTISVPKHRLRPRSRLLLLYIFLLSNTVGMPTVPATISGSTSTLDLLPQPLFLRDVATSHEVGELLLRTAGVWCFKGGVDVETNIGPHR
jgi:hypothetical protein